MAKPTKPSAPIRTFNVRIVKEGSIVFNPSTGRRLSYMMEDKKTRAVYPVPIAPYWHRRLRDGTVELCDDNGKLIAPAAPPSKTPSGDVPKLGK